MVKIPHDTCILVVDGRTALVLRNEGDELNPNLKTVEILRNDANPKTAELGTDRPGRTMNYAANRRSAVEQTNWHDDNEHRFARRIAAYVDAAVSTKKIAALITVAPPRTLADLRAALAKSTRDKVILELAKDLTKMPVHEIEAHLSKAT
jgi:protein required for attachment to host cells